MMLEGLYGAIAGALVATVFGIFTVRKASTANELAKAANKIANEALEQTRLAEVHQRQFALHDQLRTVFAKLTPFLSEIVHSMQSDVPDWSAWREIVATRQKELAAFTRQIDSMKPRLRDPKLNELLTSIGTDLDPVSRGLLEASYAGRQIQDGKTRGDDLTTRLGYEQLVTARSLVGPPYEAILNAVTEASTRLDKLDREGSI